MKYKMFCVGIVFGFAAMLLFMQHGYSQDPSTGQAQVSGAERLLQTQEYAKAIPLFQKILESPDPDIKKRAFWGLGRAHYHLRDYNNALVNLNLALSLRTSAPVPETGIIAGIYVYLSYVYADQGEFEQSNAVLKKAIESGIASRDTKSYAGLSMYSLVAYNHLDMGDIAAARGYFSQARELKTDNDTVSKNIVHHALMGLGRCALLSGSYASAANFYADVIARIDTASPVKNKLYLYMSDAYLLNGDFAKAADCIARIDKMPDGVLQAKFRHNTALILIHDNKPAEARDELTKCLDEMRGYSPMNRSEFAECNFYSALAHYGLAGLSAAQNNSVESANELRIAIGLLDPGACIGFFKKIDAQYLSLAARVKLLKVLESADKAAVAPERAALDGFWQNITQRERSAIKGKNVDFRIDDGLSEQTWKDLQGS